MMSELMVKMLLDISVAFMLGLTIFYCVKLNKRIQILQDSKSELAQLIRQFDDSTQQATASIVEIQRASKKISENIQNKLDKANYLADDLAFMIERGNKTADKMEADISGERKVKARAADSPEEVAARKVAPKSAAKAERAIASARRARNRDKPIAEQDDKKGGIEAMMERITELKSGQDKSAPKQKRPLARLRTKSEKDLARALRDEG